MKDEKSCFRRLEFINNLGNVLRPQFERLMTFLAVNFADVVQELCFYEIFPAPEPDLPVLLAKFTNLTTLELRFFFPLFVISFWFNCSTIFVQPLPESAPMVWLTMRY